MAQAEDLQVEGVAAQIYMQNAGGFFAWWHVVAEDVKEYWRQRARARIENFERSVRRGDAESTDGQSGQRS